MLQRQWYQQYLKIKSRKLTYNTSYFQWNMYLIFSHFQINNKRQLNCIFKGPISNYFVGWQRGKSSEDVEICFKWKCVRGTKDGYWFKETRNTTNIVKNKTRMLQAKFKATKLVPRTKQLYLHLVLRSCSKHCIKIGTKSVEPNMFAGSFKFMTIRC